MTGDCTVFVGIEWPSKLCKFSCYLRTCADHGKFASTIVTAVLEQMKVKDYISAEI